MIRSRLAFAVFTAAAMIAPAEMSLAQETVIVPTRVIYPGETVSREMLNEVPFTRGDRNLPPLAIIPEDAAGKVTLRTLLPGRLIPVGSLREAYAVEAGTPVQVLFVEGALEISATGVPLQPGIVGDVIKVRNMDSGAVFDGIVMADGTVRVGS